ncbi:protein-glutamate O-methyltransferase CheR [Pseudoroseomonas cervicalis]|uniref:CheR family methyltransferase n=1 Tax=Teichococcus cervicalis TaxID=204525 RepID=UPI0022F1D438|nr:protein-glutamate O-methyltransferase CheR [Pseudoroseomonas cervicalis]WBV44590.1 protein-glutamate O-methyltransferase CheR [Pseudoroseomonas cervicalis]
MSESGFHDIARAIQGVSGLVLAPEQDYLLETRLGPVLRRHGLADLPALARRLRTPGNAALAREAALATATHETSFFRDEAPFLHLARALPRLAAARPPQAKLRFWSAACSSGQEAYSLAMLAEEQRHQLGGRAVEILGTDLSPTVLERARQAHYSSFEVRRGLSEARLARCFEAEADGYRLRPALRALCRFEQANMVEEPGVAGPFDVILLRNLLIYLDVPTKERVVEHCARRLAPEGVLYLGAAEVLLSLRTRMAPLPGCHGAYRLDTPTARAFWDAAA